MTLRNAVGAGSERTCVWVLPPCMRRCWDTRGRFVDEKHKSFGLVTKNTLPPPPPPINVKQLVGGIREGTFHPTLTLAVPAPPRHPLSNDEYLLLGRNQFLSLSLSLTLSLFLSLSLSSVGVCGVGGRGGSNYKPGPPLPHSNSIEQSRRSIRPACSTATRYRLLGLSLQFDRQRVGGWVCVEWGGRGVRAAVFVPLTGRSTGTSNHLPVPSPLLCQICECTKASNGCR